MVLPGHKTSGLDAGEDVLTSALASKNMEGSVTPCRRSEPHGVKGKQP